MHEGRKTVKIIKITSKRDQFGVVLPVYLLRDLRAKGIKYLRVSVDGYILTAEPASKEEVEALSE